jgi:hypothetical protein
LAPPNVNEALDACELELDDSLATASAGFSKRSASALFAEVSATDGITASRAGAGALAAPPPKVDGGAGAADADGLNPDVMSMEAAWLPRTGRGAGAAGAAASSMTLISGKVCFGADGTELATAVFAAGAMGFVTGAGGRAAETAAVGVALAGLAGAADAVAAGLGAAGFAAVAAGAVATETPGFAGSPLRNSPRATRNVPFDCSMLMGLVRTRLAPMRNALATPA